jgi:thiamine-monophosphate kinase
LKNNDPLPPEDELVARLTRHLPQSARTLTGPGDDCAVIRQAGSARHTLLKADALVEGIHFTRAMPAAAVGRKALARAVSDIAAMGGAPREALITLVLPPDAALTWVEELYAGLIKAAEGWKVGVAGGETSSAPPGAPLMISVALTGDVLPDHLLLRSGGKPGDVIAVTGCLGNSFASGWHLDFEPRLREAQWLAANFPVSAMMDLSDGLARDLPRLAAASGVGWRFDPSLLPLRAGAGRGQALRDGEDYELLFTLSAAAWPELEQRWPQQFPNLRLTFLGALAAPGIAEPPLAGGWDHFAKPEP